MGHARGRAVRRARAAATAMRPLLGCVRGGSVRQLRDVVLTAPGDNHADVSCSPRPRTGQPPKAVGAAAVDDRLDSDEDRALERCGEDALSPAVRAIGRLRRLVFTSDAFPYLLEH